MVNVNNFEQSNKVGKCYRSTEVLLLVVVGGGGEVGVAVAVVVVVIFIYSLIGHT